jgi:hypothetical protein
MFILEFSDFYSSKIITGTEEPVKDHHGCMFFDDWDETEWNRFYKFLMECVQEYFKKGLIPLEAKNLNKNLLLQHTSEDFYDWVEQQDFEVNKRYSRDEYFASFKQDYFGESRDFTVQKFNRWMKEYAESKNWVYQLKRSNSLNYFTFEKVENGKGLSIQIEDYPFTIEDLLFG